MTRPAPEVARAQFKEEKMKKITVREARKIAKKTKSSLENDKTFFYATNDTEEEIWAFEAEISRHAAVSLINSFKRRSKDDYLDVINFIEDYKDAQVKPLGYKIVETLLKESETLSNNDYNELMMAVHKHDKAKKH